MDTTRLLKTLAKALEASRQCDAEFPPSHENDQLPSDEREVKAFIQRRTRLWREREIATPIENVMRAIKRGSKRE
jgi:hypothetical protein